MVHSSIQIEETKRLYALLNQRYFQRQDGIRISLIGIAITVVIWQWQSWLAIPHKVQPRQAAHPQLYLPDCRERERREAYLH